MCEGVSPLTDVAIMTRDGIAVHECELKFSVRKVPGMKYPQIVLDLNAEELAKRLDEEIADLFAGKRGFLPGRHTRIKSLPILRKPGRIEQVITCDMTQQCVHD